jgi:hypothetical protein
MKKILICLALLSSIIHTTLPKSTNLILTQEESELLELVYLAYQEDPAFYKSINMHGLNLMVDALSKKIEALNIEMYPEVLWHNEKRSIIEGIVILSIFTGIAALPGYLLYKSYNTFTSGKFQDTHVPFSIIEKLPSEEVSKKEKRYLKRFSVKKIYFDYTSPTFDMPTFDQKTRRLVSGKERMQRQIANLSASDQEKIRYIALRSAITNLKSEALTMAIYSLGILATGILCSIPTFYEAFQHKANVLEEIKFNKKLLNLLKEEQEVRIS